MANEMIDKINDLKDELDERIDEIEEQYDEVLADCHNLETSIRNSEIDVNTAPLLDLIAEIQQEKEYATNLAIEEFASDVAELARQL